MNYRIKKPVLKDITIVFTTRTGEKRIILTQTATDSDSVREAVKSASCCTAIAYRVEFITISKNELKVA